MYCTTNLFPEFQYCGTHNKPHGVHGFSKYYHMYFYIILGLGIWELRCILCVCTQWTYTLDKPWTRGDPTHQKPHHQHVKCFTYWPVLGSFNNCIIIKFSHKAPSSEDLDKINQVVLDGISDNMAVLVQTGQYGAINIIYKPQWSTMLSNYCQEPTHYKTTRLVTDKSVHMVNYFLKHSIWTICKISQSDTGGKISLFQHAQLYIHVWM